MAVTDIVRSVGQSFDWQGFVWSYRNLVGNPVAAFPSMHAAYPLLATFALWSVWRRASIAMAAYTCVVWFATVYLGHHYVVDLVGGAAYAIAGSVLVRWTWARRSKGSRAPATP
jgi:membrane-associated phospholipid phosphatase